MTQPTKVEMALADVAEAAEKLSIHGCGGYDHGQYFDLALVDALKALRAALYTAEFPEHHDPERRLRRFLWAGVSDSA